MILQLQVFEVTIKALQIIEIDGSTAFFCLRNENSNKPSDLFHTSAMQS